MTELSRRLVSDNARLVQPAFYPELGSLKAELLALQQQFVVELHRILGTPRQIENAIPPTQT